MNKTSSIKDVYNQMSCFSVMEVDFEHRCRLAMAVTQCDHIMNFFNYFQIMYCNIGIRSKSTEIALMGFYIIIVAFLLIMLGHLVEKYISPMLEILSIKLHMSEYLAGITLLSIGNSFPDVVVNTMPIRSHSPIFTINLSNSIAIILISGGIVCYLRPFKINRHCAVRDLLFLLLANELLTYMLFTGMRTTKMEAITLILLYLFYLAVNFIDLNLTRITIRSLQKQIDDLHNKHSTPKHMNLLRQKRNKLLELENDNKMITHSHSGILEFDSSNRLSSFRTNRKTTFADIYRPPSIELPAMFDERSTRDMMHNPSNPRNLFLCWEFLETLMPINIDDWKASGWCRRSYLIILSPSILLCCIFIPLVDYKRCKHGWSKLLNCTQIITIPIMVVSLMQAMIESEYTEWHLILNFSYAKWTMCLTVPLAIIVFFQSRTDKPPPYHILFISLTISSTLLVIVVCATEVEVLFCIIGLVFHMSEDFVASCIRSFAGAMGDVIFNLGLAMKGYEKMAFAAVLAAPLFTLTFGIGIPFYLNDKAQVEGSLHWLYGEYGANCYIFFLLTIFTTLAWAFTFDFFARRSAAIFSFILYSLFLLYCVFAEWDWIHEFTADEIFQPH